MNQLTKLAIEALRKQIQRIAFDANMYEIYHVTNAHAENCFKLRKKLLAAIKDLENPKQEQPYLFLEKERK